MAEDSKPENSPHIKDTDFEGTVEHCYMCGCDYIHPTGAVAGLGKCHDCFMLLWRNEADQPKDKEGGD